MYVYNWGEFGLHSDEFPNLTKKAINCMIPITENIVITGGEDGMLRWGTLSFMIYLLYFIHLICIIYNI